MKPDFLSLEFHNDPFPVLEWFRTNKPVYRRKHPWHTVSVRPGSDYLPREITYPADTFQSRNYR